MGGKVLPSGQGTSDYEGALMKDSSEHNFTNSAISAHIGLPPDSRLLSIKRHSDKETLFSIKSPQPPNDN